MFYQTAAWIGVSRELKAFLDYVAGLMLIQKLMDDNRFDDLSKIRDDHKYRQRLYKECGIII